MTPPTAQRPQQRRRNHHPIQREYATHLVTAGESDGRPTRLVLELPPEPGRSTAPTRKDPQ